jgi:hypothetical protein
MPHTCSPTSEEPRLINPQESIVDILCSDQRRRRHASLKHLLHLDNYDFVSDVNVAEAHVSMGHTRMDKPSMFCPQTGCALALLVARMESQ